MGVKGFIKEMGLKAGFRSQTRLREREGRREGKREGGGHPKKGFNLRLHRVCFG